MTATARDSAVVAGDFPYVGWGSSPYLVGDFELYATELGWRVLEHDLWENDALMDDRRVGGHSIDWRNSPDECPDCGGSGRCAMCSGTGRVAA